MESIYKLSNSRYFVLQDSFDGIKASFFRAEDDKVTNDLDSRFYKSEANAIRQSERRFGGKAVLLGEAEDGEAPAFLVTEIRGHLIGTWRVSIHIVHERSEIAGEPDKESSRSYEYHSEEDAWAAYEAFSFRGLDCYEANKTLYLTMQLWPTKIDEVAIARETYSGWRLRD